MRVLGLTHVISSPDNSSLLLVLVSARAAQLPCLQGGVPPHTAPPVWLPVAASKQIQSRTFAKPDAAVGASSTKSLAFFCFCSGFWLLASQLASKQQTFYRSSIADWKLTRHSTGISHLIVAVLRDEVDVLAWFLRFFPSCVYTDRA